LAFALSADPAWTVLSAVYFRPGKARHMGNGCKLLSRKGRGCNAARRAPNWAAHLYLPSGRWSLVSGMQASFNRWRRPIAVPRFDDLFQLRA